MAETTKAQNAGQTRKDGKVAAHYQNCLEAGTVFTVKAGKEKVLEGQGNKETSTGREKTQEPLEHLPFPLPSFLLSSPPFPFSVWLSRVQKRNLGGHVVVSTGMQVLTLRGSEEGEKIV